MKAGRIRNLSGAQVLVLAASATGLVLAVLVSVPAMSNDLDKRNGVIEQTARLERGLADIDTVAHDPKAARRLHNLQTEIPSAPDLEGALRQLQEAADSSGARWVASTQDDGGTVNVDVNGVSVPVRRFVIDVHLAADTSEVSDFVDKVSTAPRLFVVDDVTTADTGDATVSLRVFSLTDPGTAP